jgi:hypothetical protein
MGRLFDIFYRSTCIDRKVEGALVSYHFRSIAKKSRVVNVITTPRNYA